MNLQETVWKPGHHAALDAAVRRSPFEISKNRERVWAAYLQGESPIILLCARHLSRDRDFLRLESYVQQTSPSSLLECLYTLDTYHQSRLQHKAPPEKQFDPAPDPVVDEVLSSSRRLLLWQRQIEILAQSLGLSRKDSRRLRRHVNQKRPTALTPVKGESFPSGQSLQDIVEDRLYYGATVPGQWRGARLLFEAIE